MKAHVLTNLTGTWYEFSDKDLIWERIFELSKKIPLKVRKQILKEKDK